MSDNRLLRALYALPLLALSWPTLRAFGMLGPLEPMVDKFSNQSRFDLLDGTSVPTIKVFYGIPLLDNILERITIAFGQLLFYDDPITYWQALVFLTDLGGFYAILVFESFRRANEWSLFQIPFVVAFLSQLVTLGNVAPLYFYLFYVFSPVKKLATANVRLIDGTGALAIFPVVVLVYFIPTLNGFFHPDFQVRLWWNWVWQIYPVWGSLTLFVLSKTLAFILDNRIEAVQKRNKTVLRFTTGVFAAASTAMWWYTLLYSGLSVSELFVPEWFPEGPEDAYLAMRMIFQYDYLVSFGAALLWLAYLFGDLKASGICKASWIRILLTAAVVGVAGGPGTLFLFGWIVREEIMASTQHEKVQ